MDERWWRMGWRLLVGALAAAACFLFIGRLHLPSLLATLRPADARQLGVAFALNLAYLLARGVRCWLLLRGARARLSVSRAVGISSVGVFMSSLYPGLGETARLILLRRQAINLAQASALVIEERLVDTVALAVALTAGLALLPGALVAFTRQPLHLLAVLGPTASTPARAGAGFVVVVVVVATLWIAGRRAGRVDGVLGTFVDDARAFLGGVMASVRLLLAQRTLCILIALTTVGIHGLAVLVAWVTLRAFLPGISPAVPLVLVPLLNLGLGLIPVPLGLGLYQVAGLVVVGSLGGGGAAVPVVTVLQAVNFSAALTAAVPGIAAEIRLTTRAAVPHCGRTGRAGRRMRVSLKPPRPTTRSDLTFGPGRVRKVAGALALPSLLGAIALLHLATLSDFASYPSLGDEAWFLSRAIGFNRTGRNWGPLDATVFTHFPGYWTYYPYLTTRIDALAVRILGPTPFALRVVSLLAGLFLLLAVFAIARRWYDRLTAFLAVILVAFSGAFFYSAHLGRPDIVVAAAGFGAIALYVTDRGSVLTARSVLSGLLLGFAFDLHPNAAIYGPVIAALYLYDHRRRTWRLPRFWGFVAGGLVGLAYYASMHLLAYPATFQAITDLVFGSSKLPPLLELRPNVWLDSILQTPKEYLALGPGGLIEAPLIALAAVTLGARRRAGDRQLLFLAAALLASFIALTQYKPNYYGILVFPIFDLMVAVILGNLAVRAKARGRISARLALLGSIVGLSLVVQAGLVTHSPWNADYETVVGEVRSSVPAGSVVLGDHVFWAGLMDYRFITLAELTYYGRYKPGTTLAQILALYHPDYVVLDPEGFWFPDFKPPDDVEEWRKLNALPRAEMKAFLAVHGQRLGGGETQFGMVQVYRIQWDR